MNKLRIFRTNRSTIKIEFLLLLISLSIADMTWSVEWWIMWKIIFRWIRYWLRNRICRGHFLKFRWTQFLEKGLFCLCWMLISYWSWLRWTLFSCSVENSLCCWLLTLRWDRFRFFWNCTVFSCIVFFWRLRMAKRRTVSFLFRIE